MLTICYAGTGCFFIVEIVIQIQSNAFFLYEFLFSLIYGKMLKTVHSLLVVYKYVHVQCTYIFLTFIEQ